MSPLITTSILSALALLVGGTIIYRALLHRRLLLRSLNLKLLLIRIPENEKQESGTEVMATDINRSEELFNALASLKEPFIFETAVHEESEEIHFYVAVPRKSLEFAARQIQSLIPDSHVEEANDYTVFTPKGFSIGAYAVVSGSGILPIRTYRDANVDTFAPVLSNLSKLAERGEGAAVQVVVMPASKGAQKGALSAIERLKKGASLSDLLPGSGFISSKDVADAFGNFKPKAAARKSGVGNEQETLVDMKAIEAVQAKIMKPLYYVNYRVVVSAATRERATSLFESLTGAFSQFGSPVRNEVKISKPFRQKGLFFDFVFRRFNNEYSFTLNSEELASIFHLPTPSMSIPHIKWLKTRELPPPQNLPEQGVVLGETTFRGETKLVRQTTNDRRRHTYIIGQTGTGKSYLMLNMAIQDMREGRGVCIIDPHGDLIDTALAHVPPERANDCIVLDPGDVEQPVGLNMLDYDPARPEEKSFIVNEIQAIFNRLFDSSTMGPMFEQYMRNALLLLMANIQEDPATLMEVSRVFTDKEFRAKKLARVTDPTVLDFWQKEASQTSGESSLANITPYITSKFGTFTGNDYMRPIIGQPRSAFNFRDAMDKGKILLVNLSKGKIGDTNAGLLGMIITGKILMAALSRADIPDEANRRDFYLYIDEFQNFTTDSIATILSEARKYRLNLTLAHQFIAQLTDEIRGAVLGNVGSMAVFRIGAPDASVLIKHFEPYIREKDLITNDNQYAFAKILINGEPSKPFRFKTITMPPGDAAIREKIKAFSRSSFGHPKKEIEAAILARLRQ
jgi:hypothetical protein